VIVVRVDGDHADVDNLAHPPLTGRRIGVVAGAPPTTHIARHRQMKDARPYNLMTDRRVEDPAGQMLADLEAGEIDAALLWGPIGGPLVKQGPPDLVATPLLKEPGTPRLVFRITMGVRAGEDVWKRELNSQIRRNQAEIDTILRDAGVPILDDFGKGEKPAG
jgi:polar amino acid transport system substrate-binding protein